MEAAPFTSRTSVQATGFRVLVFFLFEQCPAHCGDTTQDAGFLSKQKIWEVI